MPLILVTGLAGTGKSTIRKELQSRGYEAYDQDEDHIAKWYNDATDEPVSEAVERTVEFLQTHSRDILRETAEELAAKARTHLVFLCGDPENEAVLRDLFSQVFVLKLDEKERQHRLATRTNNQWGKTPQEKAYDAENLRKSEAVYKNLNYTVINANRPTTDIVDKILSMVEKAQ